MLTEQVIKMNTKDLRWFQEICRCKSITKAAANLYISPQGLSKGIRTLEHELGVELFLRTPNGVELTRYGEYLYEKSESLLKEFNLLTAELERMKQMENGYLRLCSAYGILRILSPDFILQFEKTHPGMGVDYMEYPDCHVDDEMERGNFDVGFHVDGAEMEGFHSIPMFSSPISLLVYEGHPLAGREFVRAEDLDGEPMVIESRAFQIHRMFQELCMEKGVRPNIIFNTSGFSLCHKLCAQKKALSVVVDRISQDMGNSLLRKIPFEHPLEWSVSMIYKKEIEHNRLIRVFREYTMDYLKHI